MVQQKPIKKNMLMSVILTTSNFIFPLITYSYVARVLTATGTGRVAFVSSILQYFSYIATLGIPSYGVRECAKVRDDKKILSQTVKELLMINAISTAVAYLGLILAVLLVPKLSGYRILFVIMGASIFLDSLGVSWFYQAIEEYSYITIRTLIFKTISVVLTFLLIHTAKDILWYGFLTIFTSSASNICNFIRVRKYVDLKTKCSGNLKKHIKPIFSLFTASIIISIYSNFDVAMIGFIGTDSEVGLYNAALKVKSIVLALSTSVTAVIVPRMSYYLQNNFRDSANKLLEKSVQVSFLVSVPTAVYIYIFAEKCLLFFCGSGYLGAVNTLRILMICIIPLILTNLLGNQILIPSGQEKRYSQSVFVGMWINLILNIVLIPFMGAFGAALGTLVTECWNVFWMGGGAAKDYRKMLLSNVKGEIYLISLLFSIMASVGMNFLVQNFGCPLFGQLVFVGITFFGVYYLLLLLQKEPLLVQQGRNVLNKLRKKTL